MPVDEIAPATGDAAPEAAASAPFPPAPVPPIAPDAAMPPYAVGYPPAPGFEPFPVAEPASRGGLALAALILGIASFLTGWTPLLGLILGILAIVLGIRALIRRQRKGLAITGIVLGAVGLLASLFMSVAAIAVIANFDEFAAGFEEGLAGPSSSAAPIDGNDGAAGGDATGDTGSEPAAGGDVELADFAALDDAGLAAIVADPTAAYGSTYIVYGEVQQFDENTGPCAALISVDDAQQSSWEGYAVLAYVGAASSATECPEYDGIAPLSHVKAWVTVMGSTTTEFDDGTVEDLPVFEVRQFEALPALP